MKETWMEILLQEYDRDLPKTVPNEIRKLAAWIVFRFAIPETELPNLCWLLMNKKEGKNPERDGKDIREAYHFYIGKTFFGALDHLLIHGDLLLSEVRYGLKDIRQQTRIRIRNTKKGAAFIEEQKKRLDQIERNLELIGMETE